MLHPFGQEVHWHLVHKVFFPEKDGFKKIVPVLEFSWQMMDIS